MDSDEFHPMHTEDAIACESLAYPRYMMRRRRLMMMSA
jgi:hypothetical protein